MATAVLEELIHEIEVAPDLKERLYSALLTSPIPSQKPRMSYQEFLDWTDEDTLAEWVDGEIVIVPPHRTYTNQ